MYNSRFLAPAPPKDAATPATPTKPAKPDRWTLLDVLRWTTTRFQERGLASPRLDAEVLLAECLHLSRVQLYVEFERPLAAEELATIREAVRRRQNGECVAYIVGHKEFFGLEFAVDNRVLVPRPDTETLVDEALARVREMALPEGAERPARIADIGTGSGAVIVTLGKQMPTAICTAVDVSPDALAVAAGNATRHGVTVDWRLGDLVEPLRGDAPFDLIVANLPYIPTREIAGLAPEVRSEPMLALDGGADGLDLVRRLIDASRSLLLPGGCIALEIGAGQSQATADLCAAAGFTDVRRRRDLGTIERVVSAQWTGTSRSDPHSPHAPHLPDSSKSPDAPDATSGGID